MFGIWLSNETTRSIVHRERLRGIRAHYGISGTFQILSVISTYVYVFSIIFIHEFCTLSIVILSTQTQVFDHLAHHSTGRTNSARPGQARPSGAPAGWVPTARPTLSKKFSRHRSTAPQEAAGGSHSHQPEAPSGRK